MREKLVCRGEGNLKKEDKLKTNFSYFYLVLVCSGDFEQPVNFDGNEELLNGGETRDKLSLGFSLFPPSTDIVRRDTLYEGVYNDFGDS